MHWIEDMFLWSDAPWLNRIAPPMNRQLDKDQNLRAAE
jgi:hypothetical protein